MILLNWLFFGCAILGLLLLVHRIMRLQWRKNSAPIIVMHGALAAACADSAANAWVGNFGVVDVGAVLGSIAWLIVSFDTWRYGVPQHFTKPTEIHEADWNHISGGKK